MADDKGQQLAFIFSTHRGRKVRRWAMGIIGASFALSVFNGQLNPSTDAEETPAQAESTNGSGWDAVPEEEGGQDGVIAATADPFSTADPTSVDVSDTAPAEQGRLQQALTVAGEGAQRYATYSYQQTPEDYVALIPSLSTEAGEALLYAANINWPEVKGKRVQATAEVRSPQPQVTEHNTAKRTTRVAVAVTQKVRTGEQSVTYNRSYTVHLQRVEDAQRGWRITAIVSN